MRESSAGFLKFSFPHMEVYASFQIDLWWHNESVCIIKALLKLVFFAGKYSQVNDVPNGPLVFRTSIPIETMLITKHALLKNFISLEMAFL